jgi:DNA-directed RNA polymerase specialized sigma24 family protein
MKVVTALDALDDAGHQLRAARSLLDAATEKAKAAAVNAATEGIFETTIAATLGVDRNTVRKWLGK